MQGDKDMIKYRQYSDFGCYLNDTVPAAAAAISCRLRRMVWMCSRVGLS